MCLIAIILAGVSWVIAGFSVLVPAISLMFVGPGKDRVFSGKKGP